MSAESSTGASVYSGEKAPTRSHENIRKKKNEKENTPPLGEKKRQAFFGFPQKDLLASGVRGMRPGGQILGQIHAQMWGCAGSANLQNKKFLEYIELPAEVASRYAFF